MMRETPRKARKEHRCSCCGATVKPGEQYTVHFSVADGYCVTEKICALCLADRDEFCSAHDLSWVCPSDFTDVLGECIDQRDEESMRRWKPMLDRIRERGRATQTSESGDRP